jgi:hypothetical protein
MKKLANWWHKVTHYEYWPFDLFYFPIYFYFGYLMLKHRSFFFFTSANPGIEFGGMLGEKKSDIYLSIPKGSYPKTALCPADISGRDLLETLKLHDISFPFIAKPNIGERGNLVEKIDNLPAMFRYLSRIKVDFLIQEFIDYPLELGIFYVRIPGEEHGKITSVTMKKFLAISGDGKSTVETLLNRNPRARINFNFEHPDFLDIKNSIPSHGEEVLIEPIGNHCRGTSFLDMTSIVDSQLEEVFDTVAKKIPEFYFGRFDIRCKSIQDLKDDKYWSIIELNGAGAEPGHIYQPGFGIINAYRVIIQHLRLLSTISKENRKRGHEYWAFRNGIAKMRQIRSYNRMAST